ncbi:Hydrophobin 2 [Mycena indigotica]|uniref:Hydrophobin n=1 Tax=Mycena indigotica TaxID=2126181 RepID=A0A8H6RXU9_9AGAR|nr:Hydrophobin 2 [Mycena indigotica]KAF7288921.1 Hydrophobin 2 [Mycena indigotica]
MMLSKLRIAALSAIFTLAAATTVIPVDPPTSPQCCKTVIRSDEFIVTELLADLGLSLGNITVPVGLGCSPLSILNGCGDLSVTCAPPTVNLLNLIVINCILVAS